jgi:hypothetical protein
MLAAATDDAREVSADTIGAGSLEEALRKRDERLASCGRSART